MWMRLVVAALVAGVLALPGQQAAAQDHLVAAGDTSARLAAVAHARQQNSATLARVLARPEAARAAAALGTDVGRVRAGLAQLGDRELADLAARAAALDANPTAGFHEPWVNDFLVIFLVIAIVLVVLSAVD